MNGESSFLHHARFFQVRHVTSLDISSNCLTALPSGLELCSGLKYLNLAENAIHVGQAVMIIYPSKYKMRDI